jgi:hypothetical protein
LLRADRGAFADVGAAPESLVIVLRHHADNPRVALGLPWLSRPRWVIFAAVNSMAEPFGQAATHAPHPMQVAASKARSASLLPTGLACASGAVTRSVRRCIHRLNDAIEGAAIHHRGP